MSRFTKILVLAVALVIGLSALTYAAIPKVINYQGKFTDKDDNPLTGNYLVTFRFHEAASGGENIWEEGHILNVQNGMFNVLLGSIKPLDIDFNKDLWLGIEIASDGEMTPRIKLASSVYALNAKTIDMISSSQLIRNDMDSVMAGSLTLKKDLILKGDASNPSRIILADAQGSEYFLWIDNSGNLRIKQGLPASDSDGEALIKEKSGSLPHRFIQRLTILVLVITTLILGLIFYSTRKK